MASLKKKFVVSIYSPLGGQGSSFIAAQLVHHLAKSGPACLVDLNLDHSAALAYLNVEPDKAFRESAMRGGESERISSFAIKIEENYFAVATPLVGYGQFAEETREATKELFDQCRAEFDYTLVDLPHPLHVELTKAALAKSDLILVLCESSDHAAQACVKLKKILCDQQMKLDVPKRVAFIFNRSSHKAPQRVTGRLTLALASTLMMGLIRFISPQVIDNVALVSVFMVFIIWLVLPSRVRDQTKSSRKILSTNQITLLYELPDDNKSCRLAINQGKFLDEKSALGRALSGLAEKIKTHAAFT